MYIVITMIVIGVIVYSELQSVWFVLLPHGLVLLFFRRSNYAHKFNAFSASRLKTFLL